jgi:hypothetical protein
MMFAAGDSLAGGGIVVDAARAAAVAYVTVPGDVASFHNSPVHVHRVKAHAHMHDRGVIGKDAAAPLAAGKADAPVAEPVVHAAVVAHVRSPVAIMEEIAAAGPAPVAGRPQQAGLGRWNPRAGNPIVTAVLVVSPVTGRPHQAGFRARGLLVDRQRRRSNPHADDQLCVRRLRNDREKKRQQEPARSAKHFHGKTLSILSCLVR